MSKKLSAYEKQLKQISQKFKTKDFRPLMDKFCSFSNCSFPAKYWTHNNSVQWLSTQTSANVYLCQEHYNDLKDYENAN